MQVNDIKHELKYAYPGLVTKILVSGCIENVYLWSFGAHEQNVFITYYPIINKPSKNETPFLVLFDFMFL